MMSGGYQKKNWKRGPGRGYSTKTQKRERGCTSWELKTVQYERLLELDIRG